MHVGTRNVEFKAHSLGPTAASAGRSPGIQSAANARSQRRVLRRGEATDAEDERAGKSQEFRQALSEKRGEPLVGETDGVDHAAPCLEDPRRRVAFARHERHRLGDVSGHGRHFEDVGTEGLGQLEKLHGPGRIDQRIGKAKRAQLDA
jgi:hypothetical protein